MSSIIIDFAVQKVKNSSNENVWITDRGTQFGYQDLIVDFSGIPVMNKFTTTVLDIAHSLQQPNQNGSVTSCQPEHVETLARAGIVSGVYGLFLETHFDPFNAKSDGANMLEI